MKTTLLATALTLALSTPALAYEATHFDVESEGGKRLIDMLSSDIDASNSILTGGTLFKAKRNLATCMINMVAMDTVEYELGESFFLDSVLNLSMFYSVGMPIDHMMISDDDIRYAYQVSWYCGELQFDEAKVNNGYFITQVKAHIKQTCGENPVCFGAMSMRIEQELDLGTHPLEVLDYLRDGSIQSGERMKQRLEESKSI